MRHFLLTAVLVLGALLAKADPGIFYPSDRFSNSLVSSLCQDKVGYVWVGTDYGLNRFDGYYFKKYFHNDNDTTSLVHNTVVSLCCDNQGRLWVGTGRGLQCYDYATDRFINYVFPDNNKPRVNDIMQKKDGTVLVGTAGYGLFEVVEGSRMLKDVTFPKAKGGTKYFSHMVEMADGTLWKGGTSEITAGTKEKVVFRCESPAGTPSDFFDYNGKVVAVCRDNLVMFDKGRMVLNYFEMPDNGSKSLGLRVALKDKKGNIYIGTRGSGLFWIPKGSRKLQRHPVTVKGLDMNHTKIWALTEDSNGNIWVGCQQRGVLMIPMRKAQFESWSFSERKIDIGTYVSSISDDVGGMVWCTVQDKGVYGFDLQGNIVAHPSAPDGVEYIYHDSKRGFWLGTSHGMYDYNLLTGAARLVTDFPCYTYNTVTDDHQGHLFFSAFSKGMLMYDRASGKVTRHFSMLQNDKKRGRLCNDWIMDLSSDVDGNVWAATSSGVSCYDPRRDTFRPHGWEVVLDGYMCYAVCKTSRGNMLIGTEDGLFVWMRKENQVVRYHESEVLKGIAVGYMVEDLKGNIWCSTSSGIWVYDVTSRKWGSFVSGSGLTSHEYVNGVGMHGDDDRIYFATGDGMTVFVPDKVRNAIIKPGRLVLTALHLDGGSVNMLTESGGTRVIKVPLNEADEFEVAYADNTFTLAFSLLNFADVGNTIFEYRLDSSKDWQRTREGENTITFAHLQSGNYELEVRAIDNGVPSEVKTIRFRVRAPWYATWFAYLIYILLFAGTVVGGVILYRRRMRQQLDEDKMKFLINATHDIRSPLTLILSPLAKLKEHVAELNGGGGNDESQQKVLETMDSELSVIDRNAQRILNLVNQILDVRKIDKQQMILHCKETDIREFVEVIFKVFEFNAKERGITYSFECEDDVTAWIDRVQFDKVVSNLLSNAFKYSHDNGEITVRLSKGHDDSASGALKDYFELTMTDNGIGLRDDVVMHIFDRFYQAKNASNDSHVGTGIGLNLCKMIVDMHHGSIVAANRADGNHGSVFTVRIPLGMSHLKAEEIDTQVEKVNVSRVKGKQPPRSNYHVLLVDDDEEIGGYISAELGAYYHFSVCHNGKEGLKELLANQYDAVVSDVMMPEMDGFTMLRMIKTNVNISHVPVILLTSKSDIGNRLEGLEKGADAYMTKPFTMDELHLTIDNLINNHLRLKGKFSGAQQPTEQVEAPEVKGNDEQLMERIIKSVNAHLSDSDYGVDQMCEEVGISRAHLYRKMKDLTGISVSEFVRNIRLEQAARLLKEQKLNITQVAYTVGFSSLGYFSTVFRKHFGISPREFIDQQ